MLSALQVAPARTKKAFDSIAHGDFQARIRNLMYTYDIQTHEESRHSTGAEEDLPLATQIVNLCLLQVSNSARAVF